MVPDTFCSAPVSMMQFGNPDDGSNVPNVQLPVRGASPKRAGPSDINCKEQLGGHDVERRPFVFSPSLLGKVPLVAPTGPSAKWNGLGIVLVTLAAPVGAIRIMLQEVPSTHTPGTTVPGSPATMIASVGLVSVIVMVPALANWATNTEEIANRLARITAFLKFM